MRLSSVMLFVVSLEVGGAPTYDVVYRADDRDISEISTAGGMFPWPAETHDSDLLHHFEGESVEGRTSAFVSTTSNLAQAVRHAASLARPNSEEPFDEAFLTFIYAIRPAGNFYGVEAALSYARDNAAPDSTLRTRLDRLLHDYGGMDELVALDGFGVERILRYAMLDGGMLNQYGVSERSPLLSERFWAPRWVTDGTSYNQAFDHDTSSGAYYRGGAIHSLPSGMRRVIRNGSQPDVPLAFACDGVAHGDRATATLMPASIQHEAQTTHFAERNSHRELKRRSVRGALAPCARQEYRHVQGDYYDKDALHMFFSH